MPVRLRPFALRLLALAGAGMALRAFYTLVITPFQLGFGDWLYYNGQANAIAAGDGFVNPFLALDGAGAPSAAHPPLYPLLLSIVSALGGHGFRSHRVVGVLYGGLSIVLIGLLARRIGGDRVGLIAAGLTAVYPIFIATDGALLAETLYTPLIAGVLLCAYKLLDDQRARWAVALGAVIGLAALTRSEALLLLPLLALPVALRQRQGWVRRAVAAGLAALVVVLPWTVRNYAAFDRPVAISTQEGALIGGANCHRTYHGADTGGWRAECLPPRTKENEAEQSDVWRKDGIDYAADHTGRIPAVVGVRVLKMLDFYQPRRQLMFAEGRSHTVEAIGIGVYYALLPLAAFGVVLLRRRGDPLVVLAGPVAMTLVTSVLFYGVPRLRHAAEIVIVVLAAVALSEIWTRIPNRRTRGAEVPA
jgi:4-amino-4-deoxy-L-arabinose transferase-like glycosyltransferase